jgi:hypothetical protein
MRRLRRRSHLVRPQLKLALDAQQLLVRHTMVQHRRFRLLAFSLSPLLAVAPAAAPENASGACSVMELRNSLGYRYRVERIEEFVDSATVIVRARAERLDSLVINRPATASRPETTYTVSAVRFTILETLRDPIPGDELVLVGTLVDRDDFNSLPVPYQMVRMAGQRGDCFASEYRANGEYLLLLREGWYGLTARWAALAPLNEQLRGLDDPWLAWVRARLARTSSPPPGI